MLIGHFESQLPDGVMHADAQEREPDHGVRLPHLLVELSEELSSRRFLPVPFTSKDGRHSRVSTIIVKDLAVLVNQHKLQQKRKGARPNRPNQIKTCQERHPQNSSRLPLQILFFFSISRGLTKVHRGFATATC